jgi:hypothetical protein
LSRDRLSLEADFCHFFSAVGQAERRSPLATCSVFISVGWCTHAAAPNTYRGSPAMTMASAESQDTVFCALETYLYPHTVLLKRGATRPHAPVRLRFGGGAAHKHHQQLPPYGGQEREQASNQTRRVKAQGLCAPKRSSTHAVQHDRARLPGSAYRDPVRRLARLLPSLSSGETSPYRKRWYASTYNRRPGPAYAPRWSRPCPCHVFSLSGPDTFGPQDCCGETGPRLRRRPT